MASKLSYAAVGATQVADAVWSARPPAFRSFERTIPIGEGEDRWSTVSAEVLAWAVKTRSGFVVEPPAGEPMEVRSGVDYLLVATVGPVKIREPVTVVSVVMDPDRCGFAYGTRAGHPVSGEEAFVVHRSADGQVWLTLRSLTRAPRGLWRLAYPVALIAQRRYRHKYVRALQPGG